MPHESTSELVALAGRIVRTATPEARVGGRTEGSSPAPVRLARLMEHTLLRVDATGADVERLCEEAVRHGMAAVCVNPVRVGPAAARLAGTDVRVVSVAGFPLGASTAAAKAFEAAGAVGDGASEVDMVVSLGHVLGGDWHAVRQDIGEVVRAAAPAPVKAILESAILTAEAIIRVCEVAVEAGARFVKTSTGMHPAGGATPEAVALMRLAVGEAAGVKASGGIRDCDAARLLLACGATRIGTSHGVELAGCMCQPPLSLAALRHRAG